MVSWHQPRGVALGYDRSRLQRSHDGVRASTQGVALGLEFGQYEYVSHCLIDRRTPVIVISFPWILRLYRPHRRLLTMEKDEIESAVLHAIEVSLEAQLRAVRRLRNAPGEAKKVRKGTSQIDMVHDVLRRAGKPLHVTEIIERVEKSHGLKLERESIVSTLVKKVNRGDRFVRTDKNVFALKGEE
jgi:hypothetical protein